jgi:hypothetical protein
MIVSVFVRRLKPGATFQDFVREWEADEGFGVEEVCTLSRRARGLVVDGRAGVGGGFGGGRGAEVPAE